MVQAYPETQVDPEALPAAALLVTSGGGIQLTACHIISRGAPGGNSGCCAFGPGSGVSLSDCTIMGSEAKACVLALGGASVRLRSSLLQVRQA